MRYQVQEHTLKDSARNPLEPPFAAEADRFPALPSYSEEQLAALSPAQLVDLMIDDEDRVPRAVIDACARHGDGMVEALRVLDSAYDPENELPGDWWINLHAAMILGLIPTEAAGMLAVRLTKLASAMEDWDLQDWLSGYWPALFANKPDAVLPVLLEMCGDRGVDWYARANALDAVVAAAERQGPGALDQALAWVAGIAADEREDWDMRMSAGDLLLDFPRPQHRALVGELASRQPERGASFRADDVEKAYAAGDEPGWRRFSDPWEFYRPEAIAERQERWAREKAEAEGGLYEVDDGIAFDEGDSPFVRPDPKVGRNDPCPCGSGKKYKKCCLGKLG